MALSAEGTPSPPTMTQPWPMRIVWLLTLLLVAGMLAANLPYQTSEMRQSWQVGEAWPFARALFPSRTVFGNWLVGWRLFSGVVFFSSALLLAWRKWQDGVVLLFSADLLLLGLFFSIAFDIDRIRFPRLLTGIVPDPRGLMVLLILAAMLSLFYLFPDGRYQPRHWRPLAQLSIANVLVWSILFSFDGVARSFEALLPALQSGLESFGWSLFTGSLLLALAVGLASQVYRYQYISSAEQRQQTKWALIGLTALLITPFGTILLLDLLGVGDAPVAHFLVLHIQLAITLLPVTFAISMLRYRLWDADVVLGRTLIYGSLTAVIVVIYILLVGGLGLLLRGDSVWPAVLSTGLVALAANPLRDRLQAHVNKLLYGEREEPVRLLSRLGAQLEATANVDALLPTLVQTTAAALKLPYVAVVLVGHNEPVAVFGTAQGAAEAWPLLYQGAVVGHFLAARRAPGETFSPRERRLLATIAQQAGAATHAVQLTHNLRQSRQQIVIAREEERRRLRRDLHDGLGPQLATLALQLDAARNLMATDPVRATRQLHNLKTHMQDAIAEVRRVVEGLRPPALDQLGLVEAIRQYADRLQHDELTIGVSASQRLPALPAAAEVALYRIGVEALANVARHAAASACHVCIAVDAATVTLTVDDNGIGLSGDWREGVGIQSMRARAQELGGTLTIQGGDGMRVEATLPLDLAAIQGESDG